MADRKAVAKDNLSVRKIFSSQTVCYLLPFLLLGGYLVYLIVNDDIFTINGYYLIHYLYTYDHGFIARGLVGETLSRFFDTVTPEIIYGTVVLFAALLMVSASLCIGKALSKVRDDEKRLSYVLAIIIVLCVLPMSFKMYYCDIKLDKMLWVMTLFAVFFADRKYGIWLVPVFCIIATLINPVFLFCSMILISIILLQEFRSSNFSVKNGIVCAVSYVSMIVLGLYGTVAEKWTGFTTPEELIDYYFARYSEPLTASEYNRFVTEWLFDYFEPLEGIFQTSFRIYFNEWGNGILCILNFIFIALPAYILLGIFWKKVIKSESDKFQKFIYFLCAVSPVVLIPPVSISWEFSKYFYCNFIVQLCLVVFFIVRNNDSVLKTVEAVIENCRKHVILTAAIVTYFAGCCLFYVPV